MSLLSTSFTPRSRIALALLLAGGGSAIAIARLRALQRSLRSRQQELTSHALREAKKSPRSRTHVDARSVRRLLAILRVCVPGITSRSAALLALQGVLLTARTVLSDRMCALEGECAENITAANWPGFRRVLVKFALNAIPASIVTSAMKASQVTVSLSLRTALARHLHRLYLANRAYYSASVLSGLSHPDQRITEDVEKFSETFAEIYSYTFKPLLDIIIFSRSLASIMGYRGQFALYLYFVFVGAFLRRVSPPLGRMTSEFATLSADLRAAHARIATSAEEIAFNDPPAGRAEMVSLNTRLARMIHHSKLSVIQRFIQQCFDGYLVKYTASIIGLVVFAVPLYYTPVEQRGATNVIAGKYINAMRLMMQTSAAMGELVLVYKRINTLAGHTARVSEMMEKIKELGKPNGHLEAFRSLQDRIFESENGSTRSSEAGRKTIAHASKVHPPKRQYGKCIMLENVSMWSPDGAPLVQKLCFEVIQGSSVIILGPNGSGKSSVLRMLAGLWPLQAGTVTLPARTDIFYLSQCPYMYAGTLREQLMYPRLPGVVVGERISFDEKAAMTSLSSVELGHLVARCGGFDGEMAWDDVLSGGERNRLAVARLLYHKPKFAVLDECTAAVSADGEVALYQAMADAGITLLSVAHRKAVMKFHELAVIMDGAGEWRVGKVQEAVDDTLPNGM
ncbi:ABC transporter [Gracilaria domingensis]|nr:ABC transporter [Gracilaria domingensis]